MISCGAVKSVPKTPFHDDDDDDELMREVISAEPSVGNTLIRLLPVR
jgi:hypothetical protein